jgi:hypothetical protein
MDATDSTRKLSLDDIADLRAYERERDEFRRHVIALKKRRRVAVGPFVTLLFENRDTIRFQIQEMARAERLLTDEAIETELRIYNPLIPEPGNLSATLFVELTNEQELRTWLPKLVGIETAVALRLGDGPDAVEVRCTVDPEHAEQLTREDTTASVHYVHFALADEHIDALASRPVHLVLDHPEYRHEAALSADTVAELLADLRP